MNQAEAIGILVGAIIVLASLITIVVKVTRSVSQPIEHMNRVVTEQLNALNLSINKLMIVIENIRSSMDKSEKNINELYDIVRKLNDRLVKLETEHKQEYRSKYSEE